MVRWISWFAAWAMFAVCTSANAAVLVSGWIQPGQSFVEFQGQSPWIGGDHPLDAWTRVRFHRPVTGSFVGFGQVYVYYLDENGGVFDYDNGDEGGGASFSNETVKDVHFVANFQPGWAYADGGGNQFRYQFGLQALDRPVKFTVYSISPGTVPEPGTWALMICGFGLVGAAMRRRSAKGFRSPLPA